MSSTISCQCGRPLTDWDISRGLPECVICWLIKKGAISSNRSTR